LQTTKIIAQSVRIWYNAAVYSIRLSHKEGKPVNTKTDTEEIQVVDLLIEPIPPDTVDSIREALPALVGEALREAGQEGLLTSGQIEIQLEKTLPIDWIELSRMAADAALKATFALMGGAALKTFEAVVLPRLKKRVEVSEKQRRKIQGRRKKR
jgi:hypothetical protein